MANLNDTVKVTCYGDTEVMKRGEALSFYRECAAGSDGSEQQRYFNIILELEQGLMEVDDGEDY